MKAKVVCRKTDRIHRANLFSLMTLEVAELSNHKKKAHWVVVFPVLEPDEAPEQKRLKIRGPATENGFQEQTENGRRWSRPPMK